MVLGLRRQLNRILSSHSLIYKMIRSQVMIAAAAVAVLVAATTATFFLTTKNLRHISFHFCLTNNTY